MVCGGVSREGWVGSWVLMDVSSSSSSSGTVPDVEATGDAVAVAAAAILS